jgi:hypothetical protein
MPVVNTASENDSAKTSEGLLNWTALITIADKSNTTNSDFDVRNVCRFREFTPEIPPKARDLLPTPLYHSC